MGSIFLRDPCEVQERDDEDPNLAMAGRREKKGWKKVRR